MTNRNFFHTGMGHSNGNFIRVLFLLASGLMVAPSLQAQQDPMYNQYIFNAYTVNAAEAGARSFGVVSMLYRWQWVGLEGAPNTTSVGFESHVGNGWGVSLNAVDDRIGPSVNQTINAATAYHILLDDKFHLSLGLNLVGNSQRISLDRFKYLTDTNDPLLTTNINNFNPNVGGGLLLYSNHLFFGASMPRFIEYRLTNSSTLALDQLRHLFVYGGRIFNIGNRVSFKPSVMAKLVNGAPAEFDLNAVMSFYDIIGLGVNYRTGDGVGVLAGITILEKLQLNYAYEIPLTELKYATVQTHEVGVRLLFGTSHLKKIRSPRFFN